MNTASAPETDYIHSSAVVDEQPSMVSLQDIEVRFSVGRESLLVLDNINLKVSKGEFVVLIGPSGCGKTTLLRVVANLVKPTAGEASVDGMTAEQARKDGSFSYVFQSATLFPWRTVLANVCLPMDVARYPGRQDREAKALEALERVGLADFKDYYPDQLSGGMQMRVSIARALVMRPRVLLMDEPFGALDEITREAMNQEVHSLCRDLGQTVIFVTHSLGEAAFLADRVVMLGAHPGRIVSEFKNPLPHERSDNLRESEAYFDFLRQLRRNFHF